MKVCIVGSTGKMGGELVKATLSAPNNFKLHACVIKADSADLGKDIGNILGLRDVGITTTSSIPNDASIVIDFTNITSVINHAKFCVANKISYISGVTGLSPDTMAELELYAKEIPCFYSPNMSIQINLLAKFVEQAASALDDSFDIEIVEMHHNQKIDSPSGTALLLAKAAAKGRNIQLAQHTAIDRNNKRRKGDIGFAVVRGGDIVGEHKVIFAGEGERMELGHIDTKRSVFALGALRAARWLSTQKAGRLYGMQDMLNSL